MKKARAGPGYNERLFSGGVRRHLHLARFKWLARAVAKHSTSCKTVLELGCFDGKAIDFLPTPPVRYSGFDANWEGGLDLARKRWKSQPNYTFNLARTPDEMSLDERDRFDIAIAMETLEHVPPGLVHGYLKKISRHLDGQLFVTIPNEKGIVFLAKFLAKKFIMEHSERYSVSEIMNATLGRMSEVDRQEHKGFDYESMISEVGKHFQVLEVTGIPYSRLPCPLSFGIGVVAQSRPAIVSRPSTIRSDRSWSMQLRGDAVDEPARPLRLLLFANTEWYLFNFRLALAKAARAQGAEVVMVSPPGPYGEKLRAEGFRWVPVPMARRSLNPIREVRLLWVLWRLYRRERADIAHHFTIKCVVYGGLVAKGTGVRGVVSAVTGLGYVFISQELLAQMLRPLVGSLLRFAMGGKKSRLIVQNPDDQSAVVDAGLMGASQVRLIAGSGVNTERYKPRVAVPRTNGAASILFAARLLWDKGVAEFVQAAKALRAQGLNVQFLVAGEPDVGNPASVSEEQLMTWRAEGSVRFLGHVEGIPALMATANVVVLPSYYGEGVPRSLIEAAAAGLPIVTTEAPGCREVVQDGVNGFLVPVRDSAALAAAIRKLVVDPALAARMGAASRKIALVQFDERIVLTKTFAVYRELVPEWGPAPALAMSCE